MANKIHELTRRQELYGICPKYDGSLYTYTVSVLEVKKTVFTVTSNESWLYNRTYKLSDLRHKEWSGHRLFLTVEEREEFIKMSAQQKIAHDALIPDNYGNYTLYQINRIINILNENK